MQVWIDQDLCTGDGLCTDHCPDAFVILETDSALAECKRLRQIAARKPGKGEAGFGRVVRPRTIRVKDDEQE